MNYVEHSILALSTAGAGMWLLDRTVGVGLPDASTTVIAAGLIVGGSIAVDIDHPDSFVSRRLPLRMLRQTLPLLLMIAAAVVGLSMAYGRNTEAELVRVSHLPLFRWTLAVTGFAIMLMVTARLVSTAVRHRGPLHSLLFCLGVSLLAIGGALWASGDLGGWWQGAAFGFGWGAHLAGDMLTPGGVPLLWPFSSRRIGLFVSYHL